MNNTTSSIIRYNLVFSEDIAGAMTDTINIARQTSERNRVVLFRLHTTFSSRQHILLHSLCQILMQ